jgi:D-alanyl-D-alanine carboxypeptidase
MRSFQRFLCLMLAGIIMLCSTSALAVEESTSDTIVEPTLSPDAATYSEETPELLEEDQLIAYSAILIEADSGEAIFEKDADTIRYPASTTKIMTVLLALMMVEDLDQTVTVSETAVDIPSDSSTMSLSAGEEISFRDVLYGTMMVSANDGANVIAETVSGSIENFVDLMNQTAEIFGCTNTHFANPHGYHDENHYTTARDMAIIAREAMENETFRDIVATTSYTIGKTNKHRARSLTSRSTILIPSTTDSTNKYYYEYANGIKTGSHSKAGYCFVGSAEKDGVSLISVVLYTSRRGMWTDTKKLMEYGFSQYVSVSPVDLYNMNPITLEITGFSTSDTNMGKLQLTCVPADTEASNTKIVATQDEIDAMASNLRNTVLIEYTRDFTAPITAGETMGTMTYFTDSGQAVEYNLIASRSIAKRENAPKTIEEIVAEAEADPNPFPPLTVELVIYMVAPFFLLWLIIHLIRKLLRKRRVRNAKVPKPKSRYMK